MFSSWKARAEEQAGTLYLMMVANSKIELEL
jgi:hypothetical protein